MHMSGESFIHISQFRQHISTPDLLNVELDDSLVGGGQTGEGHSFVDNRPWSTSHTTFNNRNL